MLCAKNALNLSVLVMIALFSTACVSTKVEWDAEKTSTIKREIKIEKPSVAYFINKPNQAINSFRANQNRDKSQKERVETVSKFFEKMNFSKTLAESIVAEKVFVGGRPKVKQDVDVIINYGLSDDLQIAGVHVTVMFSRQAKKGAITKCFDEFEVIASSDIAEKSEHLLDTEMRLLSHYIGLIRLYRNMAKDVMNLVDKFYFKWDEIDSSGAIKPADVVTYDNRLNRSKVSLTHASKVIAYQKSISQASLCDSVHVYSFNQTDADLLNNQAEKKLDEIRRKNSSRQFQYQQQERNRQLMYKRMRERILNQ